jgi:hypothetical protein
MMADLLLMVVVIGVMALALGVDFAALAGWICNRWRSARR